MEFKVLKLGGLVKQFRPIIFTIGEDEFYYKKDKNEENFQKYHINYLSEVYIQQQVKEKPEYILFLEINMRNVEEKKKDKKTKKIKLAMKDDKNTNILSDIKRILNVKRLQYDMNLFLYNWKLQKTIHLDKDKLNELKNEKQIDDVKKTITENINTKTNKEKINQLFEYRLNNFINILNQLNLNIKLLDEEFIGKIRKIINDSNIIEIEDNNINDNLQYFEDIDNFNKIYANFLKLFTQIKFCYILKRYKEYDKKYLLENQVINFNKNNNNNKNINDENDKQEINNNPNILFSPNESIEELNVLHSNTYININENEIKEDNIDTRITKKKEQNERIQSRIIAGLNSNSKMKENLKNIILSQNKKLYFCIKCNSLIEKSLLDKSNCYFDKSCISRSFFYCKKCKIHLCTKCITYQRGMKCSRNHKYFQRPINTKEDIKCFLCNKSNIFPYFECKYCKEQICSDCIAGIPGTHHTCFNCNNEIYWRRGIYTSCDRCKKLSDCFYYCIFCDYSICINCTGLPKKKCGALHNLEEIDINTNYCCTDKINKEEKPKINNKYCFNYEVLFSGKCSWCNATIGKNKVWGCLRCSFFLCDKCIKRNID